MYTTRVSIIFICLLCVAGILKVISRSGGPGSLQMLTVTGAPGQGTCGSCHFGGQGGGAISLSGNGLSSGFVPGQTYNMQVNMEDTDAAIGGFQLMAVDGNLNSVGTLIPSNGLQTISLNGQTYLEHNNPNMFGGNNPNKTTWNFQWQAPASTSSGITFYVAGVAADWLGSFDGDDVYSSSLALTALPVEFTEVYTIPRKYGQVEIHWQTAWEINSQYFIVERSQDAVLFTPVGDLNANGNTDQPSNYQLLDQVPILGSTYFYRVKEIDQDGQAIYSSISEVYVGRNAAELISIYPQPAILQDHIYLSYFSDEETMLSISLHGMRGNHIQDQKQLLNVGLNKIPFSIKGLNRGYYYLAIRNGEQEEWKKIVIAN